MILVKAQILNPAPFFRWSSVLGEPEIDNFGKDFNSALEHVTGTPIHKDTASRAPPEMGRPPPKMDRALERGARTDYAGDATDACLALHPALDL